MSSQVVNPGVRASLREMFAEVSYLKDRQVYFARCLNRRDQLASGLSEALQIFKSEIPDFKLEDAKLVGLETDAGSVALREGWGSKPALITTEGFETHFELAGLRDVPRELCLGLTERVDNAGKTVKPVTAEDLDFLIAKLELAEVKQVAVSFLHSPLNPENENRVVSALREKGFKAMGSNAFEGNEIQRTKALISHLVTKSAEEALIEEIGLLGLAVDIPDGQSPLALQSHSIILEDRILIQGQRLQYSPLSHVGLDRLGEAEVTTRSIGVEPGPTCFGRGVDICLLDLIALGNGLKGSDITRLKIDTQRATREVVKLARPLGMAQEQCIQILLDLAFALLAEEIKAVTRESLTLGGWLSPQIVPPLQKFMGQQKLTVGDDWASCLPALPPTPYERRVLRGQFEWMEGR